MDKKMISIDDLVRQRLSGGEEKERPGAWLQMRELLDKEQPVRVAAGYNWKRILTYAASLLLLATASVGGYHALYSIDSAEEKAAPAGYTRKVSGGVLSSVSDAPVAVAPAASVAAHKEPKENGVHYGNKNTVDNKLQQTATNNNKNTIIKPASLPIAKSSIDNMSDAKKTTKQSTELNTNTVAKTDNKQAASQANNNDSDNTKNSNNNTGNHNIKPSSATTAPLAAISSTSAANNSVPTPPKRNQLSPEQTNPRYRKSAKYVDSVDMIATKETNRRGLRKIDTIQTGKLATDRFVDVDEMMLASANEVNAATNTQASAELKKSENLDLLANHKIETKKLGNKNYNPTRFEEMVQNAKLNLSGVSFHTGLMGGVSSTVGNYNMMGGHMGVALMMNISERWGMFAELKGIYRFGNGKSLINNYNRRDIDRDAYLGNNKYSYGWDSVEHSFNITSSSAIELPIAVRYSVKRVNIFAGVNTAYNFAVKVDEKEQAHDKNYLTNSSSVKELESQWGENNKVATSDFAARFTMGYMLGVGYQVSPSLGIDIRATQPVWDNGKAKTLGAYEVSKALYRTPTFQFNVIYRLSNNKYKPRERQY